MEMIRGKQKKGVSPVIATVLLVAMVIVIALIIFIWFRGLSKEAVTKFGDKNIELVCQDLSFSADYSGGILTISNVGNVPIYSFNLKISETSGHETKEIKDVSNNWPKTGLRQGGVFNSQDLSSQLSTANNVLVVPILVGKSGSAEKSYVCADQYGQQITVA